MEKTVEERAKIYEPDAFDVDEIIPAREGHIVNLIRLAYINGATEQQKLDEDIFEEFLTGLRGGNIWEGTEWKYQRLWREAKQTMEE